MKNILLNIKVIKKYEEKLIFIKYTKLTPLYKVIY